MKPMNGLHEPLGIVCKIPFVCVDIFLEERGLNFHLIHKGARNKEEVQFCSPWKENHIHRKTDKMKRQRTLYQMKEQDKTPEKQLNEVVIGNLPEKEFRIMIVKMIQDLGKRMRQRSRTCKKCLTNI